VALNEVCGLGLRIPQNQNNLITVRIAADTTLLGVDKDEFLAADCIDYI